MTKVEHRLKINKSTFYTALMLLLLFATAGCSPGMQVTENQPDGVLAASSILADITQNIAGDSIKVDTLIPNGMDPHTFEPTPGDITRIADANLLILNGGGLEQGLDEIITNADGEFLIIEASHGLEMRQRPESEHAQNPPSSESAEHSEEHDNGDPHFWLDPISMIKYVENIRDGLVQLDPTNEAVFHRNAAVYIQKLTDLDSWIRNEVEKIPVERRLLITNHESFGYYADRYGFQVIGTVLRSANSGAAPTAKELAELVTVIRKYSAPAIFLETGSNPDLANQIANETGAIVINDLHSHSLSESGGPAQDYLQLMRYNTILFINALK